MPGFKGRQEVRFGKATVTVMAVTMTMMAAQAAFSDESGTYRAIRSFHHDYITIDHGGQTFTGGMARGTRTIIESSGGPFVEGANSYTQCLVFSTSSKGAISLEAPCTDTDASGDVMYTRAVRNEGTVGAGGGGEGVWELLGGTGQYEGVTGSCTYRTEYLEGGVAVVHADCVWSNA